MPEETLTNIFTRGRKLYNEWMFLTSKQKELTYELVKEMRNKEDKS